MTHPVFNPPKRTQVTSLQAPGSAPVYLRFSNELCLKLSSLHTAITAQTLLIVAPWWSNKLPNAPRGASHSLSSGTSQRLILSESTAALSTSNTLTCLTRIYFRGLLFLTSGFLSNWTDLTLLWICIYKYSGQTDITIQRTMLPAWVNKCFKSFAIFSSRAFALHLLFKSGANAMD